MCIKFISQTMKSPVSALERKIDSVFLSGCMGKRARSVTVSQLRYNTLAPVARSEF